MIDGKTFYQVLGVHDTADRRVIRAAFRKLARTHHPDKLIDDKRTSNLRMSAINVAYQTLRHPEKRQKYDQELKRQATIERERTPEKQTRDEAAAGRSRKPRPHPNADNAARSGPRRGTRRTSIPFATVGIVALAIAIPVCIVVALAAYFYRSPPTASNADIAGVPPASVAVIAQDVQGREAPVEPPESARSEPNSGASSGPPDERHRALPEKPPRPRATASGPARNRNAEIPNVAAPGPVGKASKRSERKNADVPPGASPGNKQGGPPRCPGTYNAVAWTNCAGELTFADGAKYVGELRDGAYHGRGAYMFPDGRMYVGECNAPLALRLLATCFETAIFGQNPVDKSIFRAPKQPV